MLPPAHPKDHIAVPEEDAPESTTPQDSSVSTKGGEIFRVLNRAIKTGSIRILDPLSFSTPSTIGSPKPPTPFSFRSSHSGANPEALLPAFPITSPAKPPVRRARRILQHANKPEDEDVALALQKRVEELQEQLEIVQLDARKAQELVCERLEAVYSTSPYVTSVMVHIDQYTGQAVAVAAVDDSKVMTLALSQGIYGDIELLVNNHNIINLVHSALNKIGEKAGLPDSRLLQGLVLSAEQWTPQSGFVVLNRAKIYKAFKSEIATACP